MYAQIEWYTGNNNFYASGTLYDITLFLVLE